MSKNHVYFCILFLLMVCVSGNLVFSQFSNDGDLVFYVDSNSPIVRDNRFCNTSETPCQSLKEVLEVIGDKVQQLNAETISITLFIMSHLNNQSNNCNLKLPNVLPNTNLIFTSFGSNERYSIFCNDKPLIDLDNKKYSFSFQQIKLQNMVIESCSTFYQSEIESVRYSCNKDFKTIIQQSSFSGTFNFPYRLSTSVIFNGSTINLQSLTLSADSSRESIVHIIDTLFNCRDILLFNLGEISVTNSTLEIALLNLHSTNSVAFEKVTFIEKREGSSSSFGTISSIKFKNCTFIPTSALTGPTIPLFNFLLVFYINFEEFKYNNGRRPFIKIEQASDIVFDTLEMSNNNSPMDSLITINNCFRLSISDSTFTNNRAYSGGVVSLQNIFGVIGVERSIFIGNIAEMNGGAIQILPNLGGKSYNQLIITDCKFNNNKALNGKGGALYIIETAQSLSVSGYFGLEFIENYSFLSGGALYLNTTRPTVLVSTLFKRNMVAYAGVVDCPNIRSKDMYDCDGSGGAMTHIELGNDLRYDNVSFTDNFAVRGGALFLYSSLGESGMTIEDCRMEKNWAMMYGGGIFLIDSRLPSTTSIKTVNNVAIYGTNFASNIKDVDYKNDNDIINIYPGEIVNITIFGVSDHFQNNILHFNEMVGLSSTSDNITLYHKISMKSYPFNVTMEVRLKNINVRDETLIVELSFGTSRRNFSLNVLSCPDGMDLFSTSDPFSKPEYVCQPKFPLTIVIIFSVIGGLIIFLFGIGFGSLIGYYFLSLLRKYRKWSRREKAERDMEKRLLDPNFIFGNTLDDDIQQNSLIQSDYQKLSNSEMLENDKLKKKHRNLSNQLNNIIPTDEIKIIKKIGEGGFGTVYLAQWKATDVAVKALRMDEDDNNEEFEKEAALLSNLRNPHIVTFFGVSLAETRKYMVVEYMPRGSLQKAIYQSKAGVEPLTFSQKIKILLDVASGVSYLHNLKPYSILHRDLKPGNILLDQQGSAKVCDFGLSRLVSNNTQTSFTTNVGSLFYMAPELMNDSSNLTIGPSLDVYSFAIIMWELFFEESPYVSNSQKIYFFSKENDQKDELSVAYRVPMLVVKGLRPVIPFIDRHQLEIWSDNFMKLEEKNSNLFKVIEQYIELMKNCWSQNPNDRYSFDVIVEKLLSMHQQLNV